MIGTETAATSSVEVSSHETLLADVSSSAGQCREDRDEQRLRQRDDEGPEADEDELRRWPLRAVDVCSA